ncbi:MAG TPA: SigE family RNA polymerase sigma factor [Mycobacteriales bacterium]|nr:SigE family RNA polymerase sigma factor [Mycobacteriales bacterium]
MPTEPDFGEYVLARRSALLRFALAMSGNPADAEDLVQTALTKTALRWSSVRRESADAYVRRAIVRLHINRWRSPLSRERTAASLPDQAVPPEDSETRQVVWAALAGLPPKQRAVIVLRYYEDLSEADIATVLGCSRGTVKSQASKAMAHLRAMTGLRDDFPAEEASHE